jgi:hypothetical protein
MFADPDDSFAGDVAVSVRDNAITVSLPGHIILRDLPQAARTSLALWPPILLTTMAPRHHSGSGFALAYFLIFSIMAYSACWRRNFVSSVRSNKTCG